MVNEMKIQNLFMLIMASLGSVSVGAAEVDKPIPDTLSGAKTSVSYRSDTMQQSLASVTNLGDLARDNPVPGVTGGTFGFSAGSMEAQYFLAGGCYSQAIALARGGDYAEAAKRLESLSDALIKMEAPGSLYHYLVRMKYLVEKHSYKQEALVEMLSLFQPLLEDFARSRSEDAVTLVQSGAWLVDMSMALSAGNSSMLKDRLMLDHMRSEMKRMDAPPGVQDALEEISSIGSQENVTERNVGHVLQLVRNMQQLLG